MHFPSHPFLTLSNFAYTRFYTRPNQVHYTGPDRGVEGLAALTLSLDPSLIPYADIKLNAEYEVDFGPRGYIVSFTPVKF